MSTVEPRSGRARRAARRRDSGAARPPPPPRRPRLQGLATACGLAVAVAMFGLAVVLVYDSWPAISGLGTERPHDRRLVADHRRVRRPRRPRRHGALHARRDGHRRAAGARHRAAAGGARPPGGGARRRHGHRDAGRHPQHHLRHGRPLRARARSCRTTFVPWLLATPLGQRTRHQRRAARSRAAASRSSPPASSWPSWCCRSSRPCRATCCAWCRRSPRRPATAWAPPPGRSCARSACATPTAASSAPSSSASAAPSARRWRWPSSSAACTPTLPHSLLRPGHVHRLAHRQHLHRGDGQDPGQRAHRARSHPVPHHRGLPGHRPGRGCAACSARREAGHEHRSVPSLAARRPAGTARSRRRKAADLVVKVLRLDRRLVRHRRHGVHRLGGRRRAAPRRWNWDFFTQPTPQDVTSTAGGFANAIVGTLVITGGGRAHRRSRSASSAGVYLAEFGRNGRVATAVRMIANVVMGVPVDHRRRVRLRHHREAAAATTPASPGRSRWRSSCCRSWRAPRRTSSTWCPTSCASRDWPWARRAGRSRSAWSARRRAAG